MRKALLALGALLLAWVAAWQIAIRLPAPEPAAPSGEKLDPQRLRGIAIAPRDEALSFARYRHDSGQPHLLLVSRYADGQVSGIDVQQVLPGGSTDPVALFEAQGYDALRDMMGPETRVATERLLLPFAGPAEQIAVGINYPSHGAEVAVRDSFIFPKVAEATPFDADVPAGTGLLDYEIELGFVLLAPLERGELPAHAGLVLASDYTDRAALMRHVNLRDVSSGEGFTQGKSGDGLMPIGNLLVIPKDYDTFYRSLVLELWRNGEKRQHAEPARMSWDFRRIVAESFAREGRRWRWNGAAVRLPIETGVIPARTIILSGTPDGVIYRQPTARQLFAGVSEMLFTLRWNPPNAILEPFLREAHRSGGYLEPGDEIVMRADRLGVIRNRVVE